MQKLIHQQQQQQQELQQQLGEEKALLKLISSKSAISAANIPPCCQINACCCDANLLALHPQVPNWFLLAEAAIICSCTFLLGVVVKRQPAAEPTKPAAPAQDDLNAAHVGASGARLPERGLSGVSPSQSGPAPQQGDRSLQQPLLTS